MSSADAAALTDARLRLEELRRAREARIALRAQQRRPAAAAGLAMLTGRLRTAINAISS